MAIGRVAGPMLLSELDRQGVDLFYTSSGYTLFYMDFTKFNIGVNTSIATEKVTVNGNLSAANIIFDSSTIQSTIINRDIVLQHSGTGYIRTTRANIQSGLINSTTIGSITPDAATFTTVDTTGKATLQTANVRSLTDTRVTFTDSNGLADDPGLRYFTSNSTLIAGNIISTAGTVGYGNIILVDSLTLVSATPNRIAYWNASKELVDTAGLAFDPSVNLVTTSNIALTGQATNRIAYIDSSNKLVVSPYLRFDGFSITANGSSTFGTVNLLNNVISTTGVNQDLVLTPNGSGRVSVTDHLISDLATPLSPGDAVNKQYVDDRISISSVNSIRQDQSRVVVNDNAFGVANVIITVQNVENSRFEAGWANIQAVAINDNLVTTRTGELVLAPNNNNRVAIDINTALRIPRGETSERPTFPIPGDIRFNTDSTTLEWYDGTAWENPIDAVAINSQAIIPNGVASTYTLNQEATSESVLVNINGTVQQPSQAYSVAGNQITFVEVPLVSDIIEIRFLSSSIAVQRNPLIVDTSWLTITASPTTVDQWYVNYYRAAKYTFVAKNISTGAVETGDIQVMHDELTSYNGVQRISSGPQLTNWTTSIDAYGVLSLAANTTVANTQVKVHRLYFSET